MKWPSASLGLVAPPERASRQFGPNEQVWHLNLDQIESQTGKVLSKQRTFASEAGNSTFVFDQGNVLYSKLRPYLNKVVHPDEPGIATTELVPLRPRQGILSPGFLKFYLRSDRFVAFANQVIAGAKMPRMIMDKFWDHEIPLPSIREQQRIEEILEQADALRQKRAEADVLADRIIPSIFNQMFGDPAANKKNWPRKKLGEMLHSIDSGWSPVCESRQAAPDEWGVLKLGAITTNRYLEDENKALPSALTSEPTLEVRAGDLLFTRKNTYDLVGACAYVKRTRPKLMLSDLIFRLNLTPNAEVHLLYLWALLICPSKRPAIQLLAGGSAGSMPNISKGRLETLDIETPPFHLQKAFAATVSSFDNLDERAEKARKNIGTLFATIIHRAYTGELTAQWREAHMKELLAEMEQQARLLRSTTNGRN